jgi:hypothetical protein
MAAILPLRFHHDRGAADGWNVKIYQAVIAGWTGRDAAAVEKHIRELEALGVKRPASAPIFYRVSAARVTLDPAIEVLGDATGGEVEFVLLQSAGRLWVGAGSDHTDRAAETYSVPLAKQVCEKPIAAEFWAFDDVAPHWDRLVLRSSVVENGVFVPYQEGTVDAMRHPEDLIRRFSGRGELEDGTLMFCGTLATKGGIRSSPHFAFELEDPVRGRKISRGYDVVNLPVAG